MGRYFTEAGKKLIRDQVAKINSEKDRILRENADKELIETIYELVGNGEKTEYTGIINNSYINYDSNCGLTIVEASIDFEPIADYILANGNVNAVTFNDAVDIMNEFSERDEYWDDLIDENGYAKEANYIIDKLSYLMSEQKDYDEEFRRDLKNYKLKRR